MVKLTVRRRKNMEGKRCVAPFINGDNVWDIPEKEWTPAVQEALVVAYHLGVDHTAGEGYRFLMALRAQSSHTEPDSTWREEHEDGH